FAMLALRAYPAPAGGFDPSQPTPAHAIALNRALATVSFPVAYGLGNGSGHTDVATWQLVAWLSHRHPAAIAGIDSGDVYCTRPFDTSECVQSNGFCDLTPMVDCIL